MQKKQIDAVGQGLQEKYAEEADVVIDAVGKDTRDTCFLFCSSE
jgi:hypothetical protein